MFKFLPFLLLVILLLGCTGSQGEQGAQGAQGSQGERGDQGIQGEQGLQGAHGIKGAQGVQGLRGIEGEQGEQGVQGRRGAQGDQGEQGAQGVPGEQGAKGAQGAQGKGIELPVMFYTLGDLNRIAPRLEEELGGAWEAYENTLGSTTIRLTSPAGYVFQGSSDASWYVEAATTDPEQHERLIAGFLRSVDPAAAAQRVAERVVANRTASARSCQGPRMLELYTYQNDDGAWTTFFIPVLSRFYSTHPAC